jgi:hypothetical protein
VPVGRNYTNAIAAYLTQQFLGGGNGGVSLVIGFEVDAGPKPANGLAYFIEEGHGIRESVGE